jgi:putative ABC transport system permease protein
MGIPLLRGRTFLERDDKSSIPVMVVNETFAQRFWPDEDPVGQWIRLRKPDGQAVQIIGVVCDSVLCSVKEKPAPYLFLPYAQHYHWENTLVVESHRNAASLIGPMREILISFGEKPLQSDINTMAGYIRARLAGEEFLSKMTGLFGLLGLGLASVGLYGVLAYMVNQQTHDIGVRMALGAQHREVLTLFLRRGMSLVVIGAAVGIPIAVALGFLLRGVLYGVSPMDPISIAIALAFMLTVAFLACYSPARRAANIDPMEALRYE